MFKSCFIVVLFLCLSFHANALTTEKLETLTESIRDMCSLPDRFGEYLKVEGDTQAGLPVKIKMVNLNISGRMSYEKWHGISINLDKYKTDPRKCAIEMMQILLPALNEPNEDTPPLTELCPLNIESADYIRSENRLVVKLTGNVNEVEDYRGWSFLTRNGCNDGIVTMNSMDKYVYIKNFCALQNENGGNEVSLSYKMKDGKDCKKLYKINQKN